MTPTTDLGHLLASHVTDVPEWPEPGVTFKDITPLLADPAAFGQVLEQMGRPYRGRVDLVAGIEARGFVLGAPLAVALGVGFIPVRKAGKLPRQTLGADYALEYATARIEMHADAIGPGQRVLLVDDVLATGGTAAAAAGLVERAGGRCVALAVLLEIAALGGRARVAPLAVDAVFTV